MQCTKGAWVPATARLKANLCKEVAGIDQHIGDVFAARIAGNFVNTDILGSLEFATLAANFKLTVVLGHSECGAVKGVVDNVKLDNLTATLANIRPSPVKLNYLGVLSSKNKINVWKAQRRSALIEAK